MKIKGLKKAIGEYKSANKDGAYSASYGRLMFDTSDGEIWTDYFYSVGHNEWKVYHSASIINLGAQMLGENPDAKITMQSVKEYILAHFPDFEA